MVMLSTTCSPLRQGLQQGRVEEIAASVTDDLMAPQAAVCRRHRPERQDGRALFADKSKAHRERVTRGAHPRAATSCSAPSGSPHRFVPASRSTARLDLYE